MNIFRNALEVYDTYMLGVSYLYLVKYLSNSFKINVSFGANVIYCVY